MSLLKKLAGLAVGAAAVGAVAYVLQNREHHDDEYEHIWGPEDEVEPETDSAEPAADDASAEAEPAPAAAPEEPAAPAEEPKPEEPADATMFVFPISIARIIPHVPHFCFYSAATNFAFGAGTNFAFVNAAPTAPVTKVEETHSAIAFMPTKAQTNRKTFFPGASVSR